MALRLIQAIIPLNRKDQLQNLIRGESFIESWDQTIGDSRYKLSFLLPAEESEHLVSRLEQRFSDTATFRIIIYPIEATIPIPDEPETETNRGTSKEKGKKEGKGRISRDELYNDLVDSTRLTWVFVVLMVASTVVATTGIIRNSEAIIIGSMVIAPLLGPNVALSLATTLADINLAKNALRVTLIGIFISLSLSVLTGMILNIDTESPQIVSRLKPNIGDIGLSLASGVAGALAFTSGVASALVGVMVAVALLPPLVTFGLLAGSGAWEIATGALLLLFINIICINLSGVVTFVIQGIKPSGGKEENIARNTSRASIIIWSVLLILLMLSLYFSHINFDFL
jgi:uncharacterized hydrophobic protein (TIGR00341 family)